MAWIHVTVRAVALSALLLIGSASFVAPGIIAAPPDDAEGLPVDDTPNDEGVVISGYRGTYEQTVLVPFGRRVSEPGLGRASFRLPDLVVDATLTATLNDQPIGSWLLGDGPAEVTVEIPLPAEAWNSGTNVLRLETGVPLSIDDICLDPIHPARWIELEQPVAIDLRTTRDGSLRLADFPKVIQDPFGETTIAVGAIDGPHLSAAAIVAAAAVDEFGRDHSINLTTLGADRTAAHIAISVGEPAGISVFETTDGTSQISIVGADAGQLIELARSLAQRGSRARMSTTTIDPGAALALITEEVPGLQEAGPAWFDGMTLDGLGFGATTLDGPGVDSVSYSVDLPVGGSTGSMRVGVEAAASLDGPGWTPGLDVYVNGRLAGNVPLEDSVETSRIDVPADLLRPGTNYVRFEADFGRGSANCIAPTPPTNRIDILGSTSIRLERDGEIEAQLDDIPFLLRSFDDTASTAVITPSQPSIEEAERALQLAVQLGGRGRAPSVITADEEVITPTTARHLVIFGTVDRQPRLSELARLMPIGAAIPDRWPVQIENQLGGSAHSVTIQLGELADAGLLIAIIGASDADAMTGVDVVTDPTLRRELIGTSVIASTDPLTIYPVSYDGVPLPQPQRSDDTSEPGPSIATDELTSDLGAPGRVIEGLNSPASGSRTGELLIVVLALAAVGVGAVVLRRVRTPTA